MNKTTDILAIARTELANQRTLLAFIRTSFYFVGLGLTIVGIESFEKMKFLAAPLFIASPVIIFIGILTYYREKRKIKGIEMMVEAAK